MNDGSNIPTLLEATPPAKREAVMSKYFEVSAAVIFVCHSSRRPKTADNPEVETDSSSVGLCNGATKEVWHCVWHCVCVVTEGDQ